MVNTILLNNKEFCFSETDLPILIHGKENSKAGSSLFTISLLANFYLKGSKILFLCGYHMARDEFIVQIGNEENSIIVENIGFDVGRIEDKKIIFVKKENPEVFLELIQKLPDINERIILLKNIDIMSEQIFNAVKDFDKVIISGDIDKCPFSNTVLAKTYPTKIAFSQPVCGLGIRIPELKQYEGYLWNESKKGIIKLKI